MIILKFIAGLVVGLYVLMIVLLFLFQRRLLFFPGRLGNGYTFREEESVRETWVDTADGERINALHFRNGFRDVILYFHGNAGDLSGWQYVADDFSGLPCDFFIIDYRGYGKSSGAISEKGFYSDALAAYDYLLSRGYEAGNIIIYGRSVGSGPAVDLASQRPCKGLVLESPFSSLGSLSNEKLPLFFPSLYLQFRFDNLKKINKVGCPVIFLHGSHDTLIPLNHSQSLFDAFHGKKELIVVDGGGHNDLHTFARYRSFIQDEWLIFFNGK